MGHLSPALYFDNSRNMESIQVISALSALAHETRLALFRLLVRAGEDGMAAGDIAQVLGVAPSTLSHHLTRLEQSGLVTSTRESRHIFYAVAIEPTRSLIAYLVDDCCQGRPELCALTGTEGARC